jgi:hypothetical protein
MVDDSSNAATCFAPVMPREKLRTGCFPLPAIVELAHDISAITFPVVLHGGLLVLIAVLTAGKSMTAGFTAGPHWLSWHYYPRFELLPTRLPDQQFAASLLNRRGHVPPFAARDTAALQPIA